MSSVEGELCNVEREWVVEVMDGSVREDIQCIHSYIQCMYKYIVYDP